MEAKAETETQGEVVIKYEPFRFNGISNQSVLIAHSYRKYVRSNPQSVGKVSGHGGTSKYAQWRLHAVNNDTFKLENIYSGKYLRIIDNGNSVDVGGGGGKYTLFKAMQHKLSNNNMIQPHMISLQSIQFPGCFIAVNGQCNVYSFNTKNHQNQNKNDINLYLYARPQFYPKQRQQTQQTQQQQSQESKEWNNDNVALKPGIVAIQHAFNKHLRVKPQNELTANAQGGRGKFAQWKLEICGMNLVKFKSTKSGKYLRIIKNGSTVNVGGTGGQFTIFKYNPMTKTLESNKFPGFYLAVNKNNKCDVFSVNKASNNNGDYSFKFNIISLNVPIPDDNNNSNKIVVIQHSFGKHLRVKPGNEGEINGNGGRGGFARWKIEYFDNEQKIKLRSTKSDKYLRIINNGSTVNVGGGGGPFTLFKWDKIKKTLESNKFPGFFLAVNKQNNEVISIQKHQQSTNTSMSFDIIQINHGNGNGCKGGQNAFNAKYNFNGLYNGDQMVVVRSLNNAKSLRVKPKQLGLSESMGGFGRFARWKISNHGNKIYKLESCLTNKFLRISPKNNGGDVDVCGSGGKYTQFRAHLIQDCNVVMFESVVFPKKFLRVEGNGNISVHDGLNNNKECMFKVLMQQNNALNGNNNSIDQSALVQSQQNLIEQQKAFIDQLQKTVAAQQNEIQFLRGNNNNNNDNDNNGYTQPGGQSTEENDGEVDGFEYVSSPGSSKKGN